MAGSVGSVTASLASLPLRSPDDTLFNTASVTLGALVLAVVGSLLWRRFTIAVYVVALIAGFAAWVVFAFLMGSQLDRMVSFTVPLAAIAFGAIAIGTPLLARAPMASSRVAVALALVVAIAVGAGLANIGDEESGTLELPPRAEAMERVL